MDKNQNIPNKAYMYAHISMHAGTLQADVNAKCDTRPGWISSATIKARLWIRKTKDATWFKFWDLVCFLGLQQFEDLVGFLFTGFRHRGEMLN
jgi:hypothetical protein